MILTNAPRRRAIGTFVALLVFLIPAAGNSQPARLLVEYIPAILNIIAISLTIIYIVLKDYINQEIDCPVHRGRTKDLIEEMDYISVLIDNLFTDVRNKDSYLTLYSNNPTDENFMQFKDTMIALADRTERLVSWLRSEYGGRIPNPSLFDAQQALERMPVALERAFFQRDYQPMSRDDARSLPRALARQITVVRSAASLVDGELKSYYQRVRPFAVCKCRSATSIIVEYYDIGSFYSHNSFSLVP